jgi:hypothetical protein
MADIVAQVRGYKMELVNRVSTLSVSTLETCVLYTTPNHNTNQHPLKIICEVTISFQSLSPLLSPLPYPLFSVVSAKVRKTY